MANNTVLPGTGEAIRDIDRSGVKTQVFIQDIGGTGTESLVTQDNPMPSLLKGEKAGYYPSYDGPDSAGITSALIDPSGNLLTRGAVLTDEGTFRANFANSSLAVSIGSATFTNGSDLVVVSLNSTIDVHMGDYVKLDADAEAAWGQISSINSPTEIQLVANYAGTGGTGASSRALVKPITANGATISVASGQLTLTSGVTSGALANVERLVDTAPIVVRGRVSVSQRIANQTTVFGLEEESVTPRWFARFLFDGTVNTTIKCQTGRNPTTAPSVSEIQETVITLPPLVTSAQSNDLRVEMLTEKVNFLTNGLLVATHDKVIPSQHDELAAVCYIANSAAVTTTSVVVDYLTGKNHNKLEIGVMSDTEQIVASQAPAQTFAYSLAGVIAINAVLMVIDCSQIRNLSVQCDAMGTTGVVTAQWSNTPAFTSASTATLFSEAGGVVTTFNSAAFRTTPVRAKYFRLVMTTATTGGTTTINVVGFQNDAPIYVGTQPVSMSTNTPTLAAGTNAVGDVGIQFRANATGAATIKHIVSAASTNATNAKASAGRLVGWSFVNTTASLQYVKLHNTAGTPTAGAGVVQTIAIPANGVNNMPIGGGGIGFATGIAFTIVTGSADADATATTAGAVIGDLFYA